MQKPWWEKASTLALQWRGASCDYHTWMRLAGVSSLPPSSSAPAPCFPFSLSLHTGVPDLRRSIKGRCQASPSLSDTLSPVGTVTSPICRIGGHRGSLFGFGFAGTRTPVLGLGRRAGSDDRLLGWPGVSSFFYFPFIWDLPSFLVWSSLYTDIIFISFAL